MSYNETMTQRLSVADAINYQSVNNASVSSAGIDMLKFRRCMFIIGVPSLGSAGTLDGRLQYAQNSNFNVATNMNSTNLTQITTSSTVNNNGIATVEIRADQVANSSSTARYVRLNLTGGGNAITLYAVGLGGDAEQSPAQQNDSTTFNNQRVVSNI